MGPKKRRYLRARLREAVCAVTETSSASPGSTSGASATSASRNFLIDLSSLAQTAFMQRLNAMMKTTVRITLAKLTKVKGHYTRITDDSTRKGLRVPCGVDMRSLIGQQSNCLGDWELVRSKRSK